MCTDSIIQRRLSFQEMRNLMKQIIKNRAEDKKVVGSFLDSDNEGIDTNIKDGKNDDSTPLQSPNQQIPQSTPMTSRNNISGNSSRSLRGAPRKYETQINFMTQ